MHKYIKYKKIIFIVLRTEGDFVQEVWLITSENKSKAETAVKQDDLVSRASIMIKAPSSLDIKEDGYFLIIEGSEEAIKKAEELLKDLGKKYENKEKVLAIVEEQENKATEGFGKILGF